MYVVTIECLRLITTVLRLGKVMQDTMTNRDSAPDLLSPLKLCSKPIALIEEIKVCNLWTMFVQSSMFLLQTSQLAMTLYSTSTCAPSLSVHINLISYQPAAVLI